MNNNPLSNILPGFNLGGGPLGKGDFINFLGSLLNRYSGMLGDLPETGMSLLNQTLHGNFATAAEPLVSGMTGEIGKTLPGVFRQLNDKTSGGANALGTIQAAQAPIQGAAQGVNNAFGQLFDAGLNQASNWQQGFLGPIGMGIQGRMKPGGGGGMS